MSNKNALNKSNESLNDKDVIFYYSFDWDNNILDMPTKIHMEHLIDGDWIPEDVSTSDFAIVRSDSENWRVLNNDPLAAFSEFRDNGPRGEDAFLDDVKIAITNGKYAPSWDDFIECIINGSIFSIITARGHESVPMRKGVEYIIDNILSREQKDEMYNHLLKYHYLFKGDAIDSMPKFLDTETPSTNKLVSSYLDNCDFIGVSAPSRGGNASNPEEAKEMALLDFKSKIDRFAKNIGMKARIGFSDDDLKNVRHIEYLMNNINHERFPNIIEFVVKNTNDPKNVTKTSRKFEGIKNYKQFRESQDPMQTSTMSMRTPNASMSGEMNSQEPFIARMIGQTKLLSKMSNEILKKKKKKKIVSKEDITNPPKI